MNKILFLCMLFVSLIPLRFSFMDKQQSEGEAIPEFVTLYEEMELEDVVDIKAFEQAVEGYKKIDPQNKEVITLIDYTKPSTEERFFVMDLKEKKILYSSHVLHGAKSGYEVPTSFSNKYGSNKSSLGFFLTSETYKGRFGYSLRIDGLEEGINDKARERAIVIHGSKYADPKILNNARTVPRSEGCPALPFSLSSDIIDTIKNGSLVYIYANDEDYENNSNVLNSSTSIS